MLRFLVDKVRWINRDKSPGARPGLAHARCALARLEADRWLQAAGFEGCLLRKTRDALVHVIVNHRLLPAELRLQTVKLPPIGNCNKDMVCHP